MGLNLSKASNVNESEFEDIRAYQEITDTKTMDELLGDTIILNRYKENFDYLFTRVVDIGVLCWGNKDENGLKLQTHIVKFKVDVEDTVIHGIPFNRFMTSLCFIKPIIEYIDEVDIDDFILHDFMTDKSREKIQDKIVSTLLQRGFSISEVQDRFADMSLDIKELLIIFSQADMQIFTAENLFLDHYKNSKIVRDINNTQYDSSVQTSDIVASNAEKYKQLEAEMIRLGNPFFLDNRFTKIIKPKQMEELYINFSQIPDGKNIIPVIMNGNGFKGGYAELPVFYAGAIAARVPDIMSNKYMGEAGYFNRNLMMLTYGTISRTVYDCGSKNPIPITVDSTVLEMFDGRYYQTSKNNGRLKVFHKSDEHLIGQTLWFRSPCTCNLNEDVCHVCYGTKALNVGDLKGGFIYTTEIMTSRVSQNILSAKHLLKTDAERVEYSDTFDQYFIIESSAVIPNDEKRFDIYIPEDFQEEIQDQLTFYISKQMIPVTISHYAGISIPDDVLEECKEVDIDEKTYYKITSHKVLELGGTLCIITPINLMMTQKYMNIKNLFESDITKFDTIADVVVRLMQLMYGTIPLLSTHGEVILKHLIRDVDKRMLRPDWTVEDQKYQFMRLKTALQNIESFTTAMAYEQNRHHLLDRVFDERNEINRVGVHSFEDYIFGEETI
jgi:hypothetical protein